MPASGRPAGRRGRRSVEPSDDRVVPAGADGPRDGVRSVERALDLLEHLAESGGELSLSELAAGTDLPLPTIYRLMRTLGNRGYVRQEPSRRYALGPRLIPLGESANRLLGAWVQPRLVELVEVLGETANMAMLDGDQLVYVAQVPSRHAVRMFTEVGRRVHAHCTGVGKALLAQLPDDDVRALLARSGMPAQTRHTITDPDLLIAELEGIRQRGYAVDNEEQELGVRCVAVPVPGSPIPAGLSISGPGGRVTLEVVPGVAAVLSRTAAALVDDLAAADAGA